MGEQLILRIIIEKEELLQYIEPEKILIVSPVLFFGQDKKNLFHL